MAPTAAHFAQVANRCRTRSHLIPLLILLEMQARVIRLCIVLEAARKLEREVALVMAPASRSSSTQANYSWSISSQLAGSSSSANPSSPSASIPKSSSLLTTPLSVGSILDHGNARGDSGYALEETIFGGRLRHRRPYQLGHFQVLAIAPCI